MYREIFFIFLIRLINAEYFFNRINHIEFYRNRTRPGKGLSSFSSTYFMSNNRIGRPGKSVQCGTRTVDFNPRRKPKIVGGSEIPYGAFPWQVSTYALDSARGYT